MRRREEKERKKNWWGIKPLRGEWYVIPQAFQNVEMSGHLPHGIEQKKI